MGLTDFATSDNEKVLEEGITWARNQGLDPNTTPYTIIVEKVKETPKRPAFWDDKVFWRAMGFIVYASIILCLCFGVMLVVLGKEVPQFLSNTLATLIGVVAGVFASTYNKG